MGLFQISFHSGSFLFVLFRNDYDELRNTKSEVDYCQRLVDQSRQRLVQGLLLFHLISVKMRAHAELAACILRSYVLSLISNCKMFALISCLRHITTAQSMKNENQPKFYHF